MREDNPRYTGRDVQGGTNIMGVFYNDFEIKSEMRSLKSRNEYLEFQVDVLYRLLKNQEGFKEAEAAEKVARFDRAIMHGRML
jgi:hypothetical protein